MRRYHSSMLRTMAVFVPVLMTISPAPHAIAQEGNLNASVAERTDPARSAKGVPAGAFRIFPSVQAGMAYNSNVFATENDEEDEFIATIDPEIGVVSEFARHRLSFGLGAHLGFHAENDENDFEDFFATAAGDFEIRRGSVLSVNIDARRDHEDRDSPDDQGSENDITTINNLTAGLSFSQQFNRLYVDVRGDVQRLDFSAQRNDDRDRISYMPGLEIGYEISPRVDVFASGSYRFLRYDDTPDDAGIDRDSNGFFVGVGANIDFTGTLFGQVQAGYTRTEFDDGDLDSVDGFGGGSKLTWNVSRLTSIIASVDGGVRETTVLVDGEAASANLQLNTGLRVEHELLRNLLLNGSFGYQIDDFEGVDRTDDTIRAGAGVTYFLSSNLSLEASYNFDTRSSDVDTQEFDRHIGFLGATARF